MYGRSVRLARGDYLRSSRRRYRGDPGLFGFIGKAIGAVGGVVGGLLPGPAGAIVTKVSQAISGKPKAAPAAVMPSMAMPGGAMVTTTRSGLSAGGITVGKTTTTQYSAEAGVGPGFQDRYKVVEIRRHRRIDPTNVKALRRALRREAGFIKLARRTGLVALPKATRVRRAARKRR